MPISKVEGQTIRIANNPIIGFNVDDAFGGYPMLWISIRVAEDLACFRQREYLADLTPKALEKAQ